MVVLSGAVGAPFGKHPQPPTPAANMATAMPGNGVALGVGGVVGGHWATALGRDHAEWAATVRHVGAVVAAAPGGHGGVVLAAAQGCGLFGVRGSVGDWGGGRGGGEVLFGRGVGPPLPATPGA